MAELGTGYISIIPEVSRISPEIAKALDGSEGVAEKKGQSLGGRISSGIGKTLKVGAVTAGVAAGGAIAGGLAKGMGRLTAIENAEAKLIGLGNSSRDVSVIMDNALASVKGTSYGLDAAATTAAMAVAAGIKPGKELEQVLKTTADTAGIAGASMDEMGAIFGSVAARGKLQGDDLMQLTSRGVPVLQMLADQMGITAAEASKMVSEGKVDFETFERALRENVGGAALEAGNTFEGAVKNVGAAAGRAAATVEGAFGGVAKFVLHEATAGLDALDSKLKPFAATTRQFLNGTVVPGMEKAKAAAADFFQSSGIQTGLGTAKAVLGEIAAAGQQLLPVIVNIGSALGQAGLQLGQAAWGAFSTALSAAASAASALSGPLEAVTGALAEHPALVTAALSAWAGFKLMPKVTESLSGSVQGLNNRVGGMREQFNTVTPYADKMRKALADNGVEVSKLDARMMALGDTGTAAAQKMAQSYLRASGPLKEFSRGQRELSDAAKTAAMETGDGWVAADRIIAQAGRGMTATVTNVAGTMSGVGAAAFTGLKSAAGGVINAFGGPWNVAMMAATAGIATVGDANARAKAASEQYARSIASAADTNREFTAAVAGSTGALSEQAQEMASKVVESSTAGLKAFQTQVDGFMYKIPAPDTSEFTESIAELALGAEWQEKTMWRGSQNWSDYSKAVAEVGQANKEMATYLQDTGYSMEDLSSIVAKGGPEFTALVSHMRGLGDGGALIAEELERSREELDLTIEAAQRVDPAMVQAAGAIDVLADSASTSQDKLSALHSLMQAMGLAPKDAEQAMFDAAAAVDEIVEAASKAERPVEQLGDALFGLDGKLDPANESARDLNARLNSMVGDLENVAANGGDVQAAFEGMAPAIAATAEEFGLSEERVQELLAAYGGVPDKLETAVALEGASDATKEIGEVWTALETMKNDGKSTIEIGAVGDGAKAVMDELGVKWEETIGPDGQKNLEISAADDEAIASIQRVAEMAAELGDREFSPTVLLDTSQVQVIAEQAQAMLDALNIQKPTPKAQFIIDQLQENQSIAMGDLAFLAAQSPTPKADLDKALLDNGVKLSKDQVASLDKVTGTAKADVNNEPARRGVEETKGFLASIKDKVVNIFTRRHDNAADGLINYGESHRVMAAGGAGRMSQQPAQIAAGGRWITWAEDETAGESFIPHAMSKRKRSTQILAETANIFGYGLVDGGGNPVRRDGTSVAPVSQSFMADGGVTANDVLAFVSGRNVGGKQAPASLEGYPYTWGGGLLGNWGDCSGAMSGIAAFISGAPLEGRKFATGNEGQVLASMGAKSGLGTGARMAFGWFNGGPYGGHTAGTLYFDNGDRINFEMGGGRGDGQIGGAAAGADNGQFTDHAYLPLNGGASLGIGEVDSDYDTSMSGVASTSVNGITLKSGKSVSWGKAQSLYDQAREYQRNGRYWEHDLRGQIADAMRLFDSGGVWKSGQIGVNLSGADEYVFTNDAMRDFRGATSDIREAAVEISEAFRGNDWGYGSLATVVGEDPAGRIVSAAASAGDSVDAIVEQFSAAVDRAEASVLDFGRDLGGEFIGSTQVVRDAEKGLYDTRANIASQTENVSKAEEEVAEARKALAEAESKGGGLDVAQKRKLEDAEANLAKARKEGKPDKIADAEKKLARAREDADASLAKSQDKNAKEVRKAQEQLNKSEDKLREAREAQQEAVEDLEAAERTAIAARYQAVSDLAIGIGEQMDRSMQTIAGLFDQFGKLAGYVDEMRQSISKLHMQQQTLSMERLQALADLHVKTQDVQRAQLRGAIGVAQAEWELEQARESAKLAGLTSVEAMAGAMDRFYRTGIFSIEGLTEAEIENSKEVRAALWNVEVARKQAALDELEAARAREVATLRVAEATLQQTKAAQLLELQTRQLTQATAQLNGMSKNQATGAAAGFNGVGRAVGGAGKLVGGIAAALAGFAVGGPLGAIPGAITAVKGLGDTVQGASLARANRKEMDQAWKNMGVGSKAAVVGGSLLGGVAAGAGGVLGGADGAALGAELGSAIVDATVGSVSHDIGARMDALERRQADELTAFELDFAKREHELNSRSLDREIDYIYARDKAQADLEFATMMRESVAAPTEKLEKAYREAAEAERVRSEQQHQEQMRAGEESRRIQSEQLREAQQVPTLLRGITALLPERTRSQVSGVGYFA